MKKIITFLLVFIFAIQAKSQLQSYELLGSYSLEQLQTLADQMGVPDFIISVDYAIDVYKVLYKTPHPNGDTIVVSGTFFVPQGINCSLPLASYQHGTISKTDDVPSNFSREFDIGLLFGTAGYFVAMPDLIGLGESPGFHLYMHAKSEATATIDMIRACRQMVVQQNLLMNDQVFLFGYSHGGHSTMAAHREIETYHSDEITVTACAPLSGPYDVSGVQTDFVLADTDYSSPGYLPYVALSYQLVYGNLYSEISEMFIAPYDTLIPMLFDGNHFMNEINDALPSVPKDMLQPDYLDAMLNDNNHPVWMALRDNDVYDWTPVAPTKIIYCEADDKVTHLNALVAYDKFIENGAQQIEIANLGPLDHSDCTVPALLSTKLFFDTYKSEDNNLSVSGITTNVSEAGAADGSITLTVTGGIGSLSFLWSNGESTADISNLAEDTYTVTVTDANGCSTTDEFTIEVMVTAVDNPEEKTHFLEVFPNPSREALYIHLPNPQKVYEIRITDINGRRVFYDSQANGEDYHLKGDQLGAGFFLIEAMEGGQYYYAKIIRTNSR